MYDRILVPTDGSDVAETAAEAALTLANRFDADLHVVHVLDVGDLPPWVEDEDADEFATRGRDALSTVATMADEADVEVTTKFIESTEPIHRAILQYADEHDVDCIVMGTFGRTGLDRFVLGSIAEQTLRESPVPVLTVHGETTFAEDFDDILVPTDGSDSAEAAAAHAIDLALATDATLHIVHAVDPGIAWDEMNAGVVLDALEEAGKRALDAVIEDAETAGVSGIESAVVSGAPHRAITEYADDRDVDCVVMGTHGRTGIDRYLLGSVTERVVRLADAPVLALKSDDAAD